MGIARGQGLTEISSTQKVPLGTVIDVDGKSYVYVQVSASAGTVANGTVLYGTVADANVVIDDPGTTGQILNLVRGVSNISITVAYYAWIQTWGAHSAVDTNGDDDIATGDAIIGSTTDGVVNSVAKGTAPTQKVIGWATSVDSDTDDTVPVYLTLERGGS